MIRGFKIIDGMNKGLEKYMAEMGITKASDLVGDLYKRVTSFETLLKKSSSEKVQVNEETCTGCNICVVACDDAGYDALKLKSLLDSNRTGGTRKVAEVIYDSCTGCNLCVAVCPVPNCMSLYDSKLPFPYELADNYTGNTLV